MDLAGPRHLLPYLCLGVCNDVRWWPRFLYFPSPALLPGNGRRLEPNEGPTLTRPYQRFPGTDTTKLSVSACAGVHVCGV